MEITCEQKPWNLLVLKTYNYHELSINFPLIVARSHYMINYMFNYMVITCEQKNGNLLVLKTYNYHELSINFCPFVLWSKINICWISSYLFLPWQSRSKLHFAHLA
jgi:hypothetical protein